MLRWGDQVTLTGLLKANDGPSETVTPMRFATLIRRKNGGEREAVRMRWGLVPPWVKDPNGPPIVHARAETIELKPTFQDAFFNRRGLLVVKTFNEGKEITPKRTEQHTISPDDGQPIAIAVVWERWGEKHGTLLETFAMVTVPANRLIGAITDRMPAVIAADNWGKWLGEEPGSVTELKALLVPFEGNWTMRPEKVPPPPNRSNTQDGQPSFL